MQRSGLSLSGCGWGGVVSVLIQLGLFSLTLQELLAFLGGEGEREEVGEKREERTQRWKGGREGRSRGEKRTQRRKRQEG